MSGSLVQSAGGTVSLILAVAQTNAKNAIVSRDFLQPLGERLSRLNPSRPPSKIADVSTGSSSVTSTANGLSRLYQRWFRVPEVVRFFAAGNLANVGFFYMERQIYNLISRYPPEKLSPFILEYQDGVSFFVGYLLQIVSTHLLLAVLVYGLDTINTAEKYYKTLSGQVYAYALALFGSTMLNTYLMQLGVEKTTAFFGTMLAFACVNYFFIGWIVRRAVASVSPHSIEGEAGINLNKDSISIAEANLLRIARRKEKLLLQQEKKQKDRQRAPMAATKRSRGLAALMGIIQRGGALFLGGKNDIDDRPARIENKLGISLLDYVVTTGSTPISVEKVNH